jgi:drug/metabolite transporter (DMT)-like permease
LLLSVFGVTWAFRPDPHSPYNGVPLLIASLVAAAILWPLGSRLNRAATRHSLFFIPMQYWAPILVVGGIVLAIVPPQIRW